MAVVTGESEAAKSSVGLSGIVPVGYFVIIGALEKIVAVTISVVSVVSASVVVVVVVAVVVVESVVVVASSVVGSGVNTVVEFEPGVVVVVVSAGSDGRKAIAKDAPIMIPSTKKRKPKAAAMG